MNAETKLTMYNRVAIGGRVLEVTMLSRDLVSLIETSHTPVKFSDDVYETIDKMQKLLKSINCPSYTNILSIKNDAYFITTTKIDADETYTVTNKLITDLLNAIRTRTNKIYIQVPKMALPIVEPIDDIISMLSDPKSNTIKILDKTIELLLIIIHIELVSALSMKAILDRVDRGEDTLENILERERPSFDKIKNEYK